MRINKRGGLTLVEVVLAIGLFAVITVTLYPAFLLTTKIDLTSKQFTDASVLAQNEMEFIYNDLLTKNTTAVIVDLMTRVDPNNKGSKSNVGVTR